MGRGGARVGWAASGARSGERRPPLSGSGASAPEVVPLHSYPRRGLTGKFVDSAESRSVLLGNLMLLDVFGAILQKKAPKGSLNDRFYRGLGMGIPPCEL